MAKSSRRSTITVEELAEELGIGLTAAYHAVQDGVIPAIRIGRRWIVPKAALDRLLQGAIAAEDSRRSG